MLLLALLVLAQDPFPRLDADPEGTVVDERGAPVAGASVELLGDFAVGSTWSCWTVQVMARTPLPNARSDKDGHFVLPLTAGHRLQTDTPASGGDTIWLVVSKPGHVTWREPLSTGLRNYLGSRVVLPTVAGAGDVAELPWPPLIQMGRGVHQLVVQPLPVARGDLQRRPPEVPVAVRPGDKRLRVQVKDTAGRPVAGANLSFSNRFFAAAAIALAPAFTGDDGIYAVDGVPADVLTNWSEVRVLAAGHMAAAHSIGWALESRQSVDGNVVTVDLVVPITETYRCLSVDDQGNPVPFGALLVRLSQSVMTDSCGRLVLELEPGVKEPFTSWLRAGVPARKVDGIWHLTVARQVGVLVHTGTWSSLGYSWSTSVSSGGQDEAPLAPAATRFFLWCLARDGESVRLKHDSRSERALTLRDLEIRQLGGFPVAVLDLRPLATAPEKK